MAYIMAGRMRMPTSCPPPAYHQPVIMLDSAKDVGIEGGKFLDVAGDYVHHEHHYQNPGIVINVLPSAGSSDMEVPDPSVLEAAQKGLEAGTPMLRALLIGILSYNSMFNPKLVLESVAENPLTKIQQRIQELQKKPGVKVLQSPSTAERKQTGDRKPFMRPPTRGSHSSGEMRCTAHGIPSPSNVIYSTDPANAKRSNHEPDAGAASSCP